MAKTLKRQLTDAEKQTVLQRHGRKCYATGHSIPIEDEVHFDHIKAYSTGGETELNNIAPMCKTHNLQKGRLPLEEFRIKLKINEFFTRGDRLTLKDLLTHLKEQNEINAFGETVVLTVNGNEVNVENAHISQTFQLQECPLTKWKYLISVANRRTKDTPITFDSLKKSIFKNFLCETPLSDNILTDSYKRDSESKNLLRFMNMMYDQSLVYWDDENASLQRKLERLYSSKSIMAWSEILRDSVAPLLGIFDQDERAKLFYRTLDDSDFDKVGQILERLFAWNMWSTAPNSEIDAMIAGSKSSVKEWFKSKGLTTGYLMGAPE